MAELIRRIDFYFKEFVYRSIKRKRVLIWVVITYSIYAFILFVSIPSVLKFSGGLNTFNIMPFGYSSEYVMKLLFTLGVEGRHAYLFHQIPLDLIFPFIFAYGNCLLIGYLLNKINSLNGKLIYLSLLPVFASWFDYLENIGVMTMLLKYPNVSEFVIQITDFFSVTKSLLMNIFFVVLFAILVLVSLKWYFSKRVD
jgi:hypothetical protein